MLTRKVPLSGAESLFAAAFLFATTNVMVREMAHMWGNQAQIAARFALVWLILTVYTRFKKTKLVIPRKKWPHVLTLSILSSLAILFFTLSVQKTTIANTLFMSYATTLIVAFLLGTLLLKEKFTSLKLLAIGFSLVGLSLYAHALFNGGAGLLLGMLGGATSAVCNLISKQLAGVHRNSVLQIQYGLGAVLAVIAAMLSGSDIIRTISLTGILTTILFALVLIAASNLILYGYQHLDVNIGGVISFSELVFGALLGLLFFHEIPASNEIVSGVLIAIGAIVGSLGHKSGRKELSTLPAPEA